jgi:hypothetical protein
MQITLDAEYGIYPVPQRLGHRVNGSQTASPLTRCIARRPRQKAYKQRVFPVTRSTLARRTFCDTRLQKAVHVEKAIWHNAFSRGLDMHAPCAMHRNAERPSKSRNRCSSVLMLSDYSRCRDPHSPLLYPQQMSADPSPLFTPFCEDTFVAVGSA